MIPYLYKYQYHFSPASIISYFYWLNYLATITWDPFFCHASFEHFQPPERVKKKPCPSGFGFVPGSDGPLFVFSFAGEFLVPGEDFTSITVFYWCCAIKTIEIHYLRKRCNLRTLEQKLLRKNKVNVLLAWYKIGLLDALEDLVVWFRDPADLVKMNPNLSWSVGLTSVHDLIVDLRVFRMPSIIPCTG